MMRFIRLLSGCSIAVAVASLSLEPDSPVTPDPAPSAASEITIPRYGLAAVLNLRKHGEATMIDARPANDFNRGHISGAINLRMENEDGLKQAVSQSNAIQSHLIIYCSSQGCVASSRVAARLRELGASRLAVYSPGIEEWIMAGLPVEK